jgi:decaprenylphospho-beta-D-ribofuranose 2-oxidase
MRRPWAALPDLICPSPRRLAADEPLPARYAPMGASQSYGDAAIALDGVTPLAAARGLLRFDAVRGRVRVAAGTPVAEIVAAVGPHGWMLPAIPGAARATIGGVVAVDAHGKDADHGPIGRHVRAVIVRRSDVEGPLRLTPADPRFAAVVGGFGAGGLITEIELALYRIAGPAVRVTTIPFADPAEWLSIAEERRANLVVASMCLDGSRTDGTGAIALGRWSEGPIDFTPADALPLPPLPLLRGPLGRTVLGLRALLAHRASERLVSARSALWPMAGAEAYGPLAGGIVQHHARLPRATAIDVIAEMTALLRRAGVVSPLVALKRFTAPSLAPLGFVAPGVSIAIDLPLDGVSTHALLRRLATLTVEAGGAVYLAKDSGGIDPALAARAYPRAAEALVYRDPASHPAILTRLFPELLR